MKTAYKLAWLLPFFMLNFSKLFSQPTVDTLTIKRQLELIYERDQKTRAGDSIHLMHFYDSCNQVFVISLINMYGWPGKSFIGDRGNYTVWLVIQHAELETQEKYLPLLSGSVEIGESQPSHLAMLQDRVLMRKGLPQLFGSQVIFNDISGEPEFYQIADEENVNRRRQSLGMEPIEVYAEHFGMVYQPKVEVKKE